MQVKNYLVENAALFMDYLERELCQNGISYVKIENEIHFNNQIVRIYDYEKDYKEIGRSFFEELVEEQLSIVTPEEDFFERIVEKIANPLMEKKYLFELLNSEDFYVKKEKCYPKRNRKVLKRESIEVNQKLKRYKKERY